MRVFDLKARRDKGTLVHHNGACASRRLVRASWQGCRFGVPTSSLGLCGACIGCNTTELHPREPSWNPLVYVVCLQAARQGVERVAMEVSSALCSIIGLLAGWRVKTPLSLSVPSEYHGDETRITVSEN